VEYRSFLERKSRIDNAHGFEPNWLPDSLFDFQRLLVDYAIRTGRAALFEDCGMGKTLQQLVFAENVVRHTNKPVLLATPLAVGQQTMVEATRFGIDSERSRDGSFSGLPRVVITNYQQLDKFNSDDFSGIVLDESSAIKNHKSQTKQVVKEFCRKLPYRLCCTATAAPNDYHELGTTSEVLGYLGYQDMLTTFFKQEQKSGHHRWHLSKYRFRGHAEQPFWRWVCSWSRSIRKPSDLGFSDANFTLPQLVQHEHVVETRTLRNGCLFAMPARDLHEQREERRNTVAERCDKAAELAESHAGASVLWCELNDEGKELGRRLPDAVEIRGSMPDERKEDILQAFSDGLIRQLITKPKIGCWGLNWQHCHNVINMPSHSFEQFYQAVRRCWRFGQQKTVHNHLVVSEGELGVLANLMRKQTQADEMFASLVEHMGDALSITRGDVFPESERLPKWL
jgi:hypothetical protein